MARHSALAISLLAIASLSLTQCSAPTPAAKAPTQQAGVDAEGFPIAAAAPLSRIESQTLAPPSGVSAAPLPPPSGVSAQPLPPPTAAPVPAAPPPVAQATPPRPAAPQAPIVTPASTQTFPAWVKDLRREALTKGITAPVFDKAFTGVDKPIERIIELDRKQPEFVLTLNEYVAKVVNDQRVQKGRQLYRENKALLDQVAQRYGVQPRYIVALWGIETNFGQNTGGFRVVPALATLAYDGRRSNYFRGELLIALQIMQQEKIEPDRFTGSWAGAMGQNQFMPSTFQRYAVDYYAKGKRDIWHSRADVFASTANYLRGSGWQSGQGWGGEVALTKPIPADQMGLELDRSIADWQAMGVRTFPEKGTLPANAPTAALIQPTNAEGRYFLVYPNFKAIMKWNRSTSFAIAVGTLADRIGDG